MRTLPRSIVALDTSFQRSGLFQFVSADSPIRRGLAEKDYDALIRQNASILAELLSDAEILERGSQLRYLGSQISGIDVLFAEVDGFGAFRRFVLVEDKLLRNPEAKRTVLAQILDYAHKVQYELTVDELTDDLEDLPWVEDNREDMEASLRTGDCLLLICGDEIHVRVATLAERFAKQANPLNRCALALIAMNIYSDGTRHLLVPALVEAVTEIQRDLTIRVTVVDAAGREVLTKPPIPEESRPRRKGVPTATLRSGWRLTGRSTRPRTAKPVRRSSGLWSTLGYRACARSCSQMAAHTSWSTTPAGVA